jgi:hypothetical protein
VATSSGNYNACFDEYWELFFTAVTVNTGLKYVTEAAEDVLDRICAKLTWVS